MKFRGLKLFHKSQAGFTLIELIVAVAITSLISLGASISSAQLMNQTSRDSDYTTASRQAMNVINWIGRDALVAQSINGTAGFPGTGSLTFSWTGWDNIVYSANYSTVNGTLRRTYSNGSNVSTTFIAENINTAADKTFCSFSGGVLALTVTSSIGKGDRIIDMTKSRKITCRPKL
jgi:prepilin-type N-terminal cleavage/methylation domain-containing protein